MVVGGLAAILLGGSPCSLANSQGASLDKEGSADKQIRLAEVERRRQELHERVSQARRKEQLALARLRGIQNKLDATRGCLYSSEHKLKRTERGLVEAEDGLVRTQSFESKLTSQAGKRLREIYEGQRLNLLEMFFQVESLPSLLDLCYFQERIAEMDRNLLEELRVRAIQLEAQKNKLGQQRNRLGDLISEFAKKALQIHKDKLNQEQIAERLRTQRAFYEQAERQLAQESHALESQIPVMESSAKRSAGATSQGSGTMSMPLVASISSPFGWRRHPIFGVRRFHTGIDLSGPNHSAIKAADNGTVLYTGWYGGYGRVVIVSHGKGMSTLYAHLAKINVCQGQNITKGTVIGWEGTTGFSTGPHLHFEVRVNGKPNNPLNYLR